jgi:hypothetical protein
MQKLSSTSSDIVTRVLTLICGVCYDSSHGDRA